MQQNIHNNPQVLQQIDWEILEKILAECSFFKNTTKRVLKYQKNKSDIELLLFKTKRIKELLYENDFTKLIAEIYSFDEEESFTQSLSLIEKEASLSFRKLNQVALGIEFFVKNYKALSAHGQTSVTLDRLQSFKSSVTKSFLKEFRQFVDPMGEVDLFKHPRFRPLYEKQLELESSIRKKINTLLSEPDLQSKVQFNSFDLINDRYVIPVKSDSYAGKIGQIIARSETGNTLFVEPSQIAQMNYERLQIVVQIDAITAQLEKNLTLALSPWVTILSHIFDIILELDNFHTRAKFANQLSLSEPILTEKKQIKLYSAFHPLIERAVRNDIIIEESRAGLIISGPNTGGKTATLKTLALVQMMLRFGLFIPAEHGEVYLYDSTFYFGNDQQNLEQGLSSFAAEVKNYSSLLDNLEDTNLILIDEIFNSTSSEEASALAVSFFEKLITLARVHIVVSSHHQTLKTFLHQNENFVSSHVGFNLETNAPTYKLHYGSPGSSYALQVFRTMSNNREEFLEIYQGSLKFLDNKMIHYEKLLESIGKKENDLRELIDKNESLQKELKNQKSAAEGVIKLKTDEVLTKTQKKVEKILQNAENLLLQVRNSKIQKPRVLHDKGHEVKTQLRDLSPTEPETQDNEKNYQHLSRPDTIETGKEYFSLILKKNVLVKKINMKKKQAAISKGNITINTPFHMLRDINKKASKDSGQQYNKISFTHSQGSKVEYDCRGMRLEEFQDVVENSLSNLLVGSIPFINFIHGHGNGVLKKWIRSFIKNNPDITIDKNDTGNDGETRIVLS